MEQPHHLAKFEHIKHSHLEVFFDVYNDPEQTKLKIKELMGCSLSDYLATHNMSEIEKIMICLDIGRALEFLHDENKIIHRDVKANNIIILKNKHSKLIVYNDYAIHLKAITSLAVSPHPTPTSPPPHT